MLSYVRLMTMRFVRNLVSGGFIEVFQLQNRCLDTVLCRLAVYSLLKYVWFSAKTALNCIIVHGFLHLCFSARYLLVILHVFQPRSC